VDTELSEEAAALQQAVRAAVDQHLRALCAEADRSQAFSPELWERLVQLGIMAIPFPASYGGAGGTFVEYAVALEELARAGILAANLPGTTVQVAAAIARFGSPLLADRYVPALVSGRLMAAWAFTEPGTGSDPRQIQTRAVRDGDTWVLDGEKTFISLAAQADVALVFAKSDDDRIGAFLVDTDDPGWQPGPPFEVMSGGGGAASPVRLDGVRTVPDGVVGDPANGFQVMLAVEAEAKVAAAATCVGLAQEALALGVRYALERSHRDQPIGLKFPTIQALLGNMGAAVEAARAYTRQVARQLAEGADVTRDAAAARIVTARAAREVTSDLLQVCGAYGFTRDLGAERLYREGKFFDVLQGVIEIQRAIVGRSLLAEAQAAVR
jgi:alkylation response protein AidB-like acyl-CoA dehydrogenase